MNDVAAFLREVRIFSALPDAGRDNVARLMQEREYRPGTTLFQQGDSGDEMYVVRDGRVSILVTTTDGEAVEVASFGRGDFFGEMSIFDNSPRSATCTVTEVTRLLSLRGADFRALIEDHPDTALAIMRAMFDTTTARLDRTSAFLSGMVQWGEGARRRAVTDEFTGLYNRRFLDDTLADQVARSLREDVPLSTVMCDLDRFGTLNAEYGHAVGDEVILAAVEVFRRCFRDSDILCRYGGDEFTFVLPGTDGPTALGLADAVCREMRTVDVLRNRGGTITRVTTSQGIASIPADARDLQQVLERADAALYQAKERGRDCAVLFTEVEVGST